MIGHGVAQSTMYGPLGALLSEMFGTRVRYTGASLGYQMATLVGAGFSPVIAGSLLAAYGEGSAPVALLLCGGSGITALTVWWMRETRHDALGAEGGNAVVRGQGTEAVGTRERPRPWSSPAAA